MKVLKLIVGFVLIGLLSCEETTDQPKNILNFQTDESNLSDSLKSHFWNEATHLALREILENEDDSKDSVIIPEDSIKQFYFGLVSVYNAIELPERSIVVDTFQIELFGQLQLDQFSMWIDTTSVWAQKWMDGQTETGNPVVDSLVAKYELYVLRTAHHQSLGVYDITLGSRSLLNMMALTELFSHVDDIRYSTPSHWSGDANDIIAEKSDSKFVLHYYLKWGDCPAGCAYEHFWTFEVTFAGEVTFIGEDGDPITR